MQICKSFIYKKFVNSLLKKGKKHKIEKIFHNFYYNLNSSVFYGYWYFIRGKKKSLSFKRPNLQSPGYFKKKLFGRKTQFKDVFFTKKKRVANKLLLKKNGGARLKNYFFRYYKFFFLKSFINRSIYSARNSDILSTRYEARLLATNTMHKILAKVYASNIDLDSYYEKSIGLKEARSNFFEKLDSIIFKKVALKKRLMLKKKYSSFFNVKKKKVAFLKKINKVCYYYFNFSRLPYNFFVSNFLIFQIIYSLLPFLGVRMTSVESKSNLKKKKGKLRRPYGIPIMLTPRSQIIYATSFFKKSFNLSVIKSKKSKNFSFKNIFNEELFNFLFFKNTVSSELKVDLYKKALEFRTNFHFRWNSGGSSNSSSKGRIKKNKKFLKLYKNLKNRYLSKTSLLVSDFYKN